MQESKIYSIHPSCSFIRSKNFAKECLKIGKLVAFMDTFIKEIVDLIKNV